MRDHRLLKELGTKDILGLYSELLEELRRRDVVRSSNGPIADYAEWLVCEALKLRRAKPSEKGYDAQDESGARYEIKARRYTEHSRTTHFSPIRDLEGVHFDYFVGVLFEVDFSVREALILPRKVVVDLAKYREHVHGWILSIHFWMVAVSDVRNITLELRSVQERENLMLSTQEKQGAKAKRRKAVIYTSSA